MRTSADGAQLQPTSLSGRRVWVVGHRGMVGSALMRRLAREDCELATVDRATLDLRRADDVDRYVANQRPEIVFLAAAKVGGILANDTFPADFLLDNLLIETSVISACHKYDVQKLVFLGSSCVYPREAPQPIPESALLTGPLEPTNEWYAIAKIAGIKLCQAFRRQHGRDFISVMPTNLYGPNDNFDLVGSHVLPALIAKMHKAKSNNEAELVIWGTGEPLREFMHVDDCADALVFLAQNYSDHEPINVGGGEEISIRELAEMIARVVGFEGSLRYDPAFPNGAPRKLTDTSRIRRLGWRSRISLQEGVESTYRHYIANSAKRSGAT
ncbi:MAG: GDP-L-fucose synthase family protein [Beijerinckiaceae bacterium]